MSSSIHPTALIEPSVVLGDGVVVGPYAVIVGDVTIGDGTWIGPHVTIGTPPQFSTEKFELHGERHSGIRIGKRAVIREQTHVHQPSRDVTQIGDDAYVMSGVNVNHDVVIGNGAIVSSNCAIAGFSHIGERANLGLGCVVHQFSTIGAYVMLGMGSVITKDVPPFVKAAGNPARFFALNDVGMRRNGFTEAEIESVRDFFEGRDVVLDVRCRRFFDEVRERGAETHRRLLSTSVKEFAL